MPDLSKMSLSELGQKLTECGHACDRTILAELRRREEREKHDAAKLAMWPELVATLSRADDLLSVCDLDSDAEALATIRDMLARARELDDDARRAATASRLPTDADLAAIATDVEPMRPLGN